MYPNYFHKLRVFTGLGLYDQVIPQIFYAGGLYAMPIHVAQNTLVQTRLVDCVMVLDD